MSERAKIKERLRKKEIEIQTLDEKIRSARIYVQALNDVLKMLDNDPDDSSPETVLRPGSAVAQARDVILRIGKPVHINDLLEELGKEASREGRASLTSSLAAYVRRGEIFTRPAPNTFGLLELGHHSDDSDSPTPPAGFGRSTALSPRESFSADVDDDIPF